MKKIPIIEDATFVSVHIPSDIPHYITGSVAFGCAGSDSDLDIAFCIVDKPKVLEIAEEQGWDVKPSAHNAGVKFCHKSNEVEYNLLFLYPLEFVCWAVTTKTMCGMKFDKFITKIDRVIIFELIKNAVRLRVACDAVTAKNFEQVTRKYEPHILLNTGGLLL